MRASRATGWETMRLARTRSRDRPRRVVLLCDVSRSMQPYATIYLHLMRAAALRQIRHSPRGLRVLDVADAADRRRCRTARAEVALARANAKVVDRYGGTHLGRCVGALLAAPHGNALRGAVVIIASDGWDSDPPEVLDRALARVRRRARHAGLAQPARRADLPAAGRVDGGALPYCDLFLPAHSLTGLRELFDRLAA